MFKTLTATAILQLTNAAINSDFMAGAQTGIFLANEDQFLDYSCPEPEISDQVQNYFNMYNTAKMMMGGNKKKPAAKGTEP
jgi:hypothetical protein